MNEPTAVISAPTTPVVPAPPLQNRVALYALDVEVSRFAASRVQVVGAFHRTVLFPGPATGRDVDMPIAHRKFAQASNQFPVGGLPIQA